MARFSALPTWWIRELGLGAFVGGERAGTSLAALKVVMAVSLLANFHSRKARNSVSDLEKLTGLSRPMVLAGVSLLEQLNVLTVDRSGHVNEYEMSVTADANWGKLPYERLMARLPDMSNRGVISLSALKIYLLMVSLRPNSSPTLSIGHEKIREQTGIQTKHVRPALDILINHTLIRLSVSDGTEAGGARVRHNVYTLLGL